MSDSVPPVLHCYKHPDRETLLRCNKCDQPICISCAVRTPTGYRCKDCVSGQQKVFETAKTSDYFLAGIIALVLGFVGSYTAQMGFFVIFLAPIVGTIIAEVVRWALKKRRSRLLSRLTMIAAAVGSLPFVIIILLNLLFSGLGSGVSLWSFIAPLLWQGAYTILMASTLYYRLQGIRIG